MSTLWDPADAGRAMTYLELAAATEDEEAMAEVRRVTHDRLLLAVSAVGRQVGPVEWRTYGPEAAPRMLAETGLADHAYAAGLLAFLAEGGLLVVASVSYIPTSEEP